MEIQVDIQTLLLGSYAIVIIGAAIVFFLLKILK